MELQPAYAFGELKLAGLTVLACLIPYYDAQLGLTMLVLSLLVTGSNLSKGWLMRALGETDYQAMIRSAALRSSLPAALGFTLGGAASVWFAGAVMMFASGGSDTWAYWAASGVALIGLAIGVYGAISTVSSPRPCSIGARDLEAKRRRLATRITPVPAARRATRGRR